MSTQELDRKYLFHTFKRQPIVVARAKGSYVWDERGRKYLDFFSGLAVCGVGHCHPSVVKAIQAQSRRLIHCSNFYANPPAARLAKALCARTGMSKVFFSNSGAEANECAVKIARKWGHLHKGPAADEVIVFENAFHGRTLAMISATPQKSIQGMFGPFFKGFPVARFNDLESVKKRWTEDTCAVWIEPVQGEGGIRVADPKFMRDLAELCRERKALLMADEIQSGMGRTGTFLACEHFGVRPDVVTIAKGIAGGVPMGVTLGAKSVDNVLVPGDHGSTFGGNPLASAAAMATLQVINGDVLRRNSEMGRRLLEQFQRLAQKHGVIGEVRGLGLMLGVELCIPGAPFVDAFREEGILINCTQGNVLRFLPPYGVTDREAERVVTLLDRLLAARTAR